MKKVLHIQLLPILSGVQRFSLHLLDGLDRNEFEIWIACKPGGEFVDEIKVRGYHYLPLPTFRHQICVWDIFTFFHLLYLIKKHHFDIVHTNASKPGLLGRLAARLGKVPLIIHTTHTFPFLEHQKPIIYKFFTTLEKIGNRLGDYNVFVNNSDRLKSLRMGLIKPEKAITIYNALPLGLTSALQEIAQNRKKPEKEIIIGSTLRFCLQKNVINLITASCNACLQEPKLKFIHLGEGEYFELCKAIVHSYGLEERIILPGWDKDVLPWLKVFNVFILYSRWEAMPFSIIEAMHSGLAVIVSDLPSLSELVDSETGYIVPLDNSANLIQTFREIASDFEMPYQKGKKAAKKIAEICSYEKMVNAYRELYLSAK